MGSEAVAKRVRASGFCDACGADGVLDRALQHGLVKMVPSYNAGARVNRSFGGGERILPGPFPLGVRILARQRVGQVNGSVAFFQVALMEKLDSRQVFVKRLS